MNRATLAQWFDATILDLGRQFRWSYLPPLMVYFAAGVSGLTAIVGTFFVKDYLGLSAAFLASLGFWAGIPWALKMPLGHLVDLVWRWKSALIFVGAGLIAASILIMFGLIAHTEALTSIMSAESWYVVSALLAPSGYVIQDVVADAMTVEAVPSIDDDGHPISDDLAKAQHTTMQTLGRFAIIGGLMFVAGLNIFMFSNVETLSEAERADIYADIYLSALAIPVISVAGVFLAAFLRRSRETRLRQQGFSQERIDSLLFEQASQTEPNWWIFGGGIVFVVFTLAVGVGQVAFAQEIVFVGSMTIVLFLMGRLVRELDKKAAQALIGTALVIFIFRAVPLPGPGLTWFNIDELGFDQRFLSILSFIASGLAILGMLILRPVMARNPIATIIALLTLAGAVLSLPNIGLYYGLHEWTAVRTDGVVDARFIALIDAAAESPLSQVAMIPMLAWIARNAPANLKATFFAVMASFTNLALSASSLATKYLNMAFVVSREVRDQENGRIVVSADYGELGWLLIAVASIGLIAPLLTIFLVQNSRWRTQQ